MGNEERTVCVSAKAAEAFHQGLSHEAYALLGAHRCGERVVFRVFLPGADRVSLVGDFNGWDGDAMPMQCVTKGGIWEIFLPADLLSEGQFYKYRAVYGDSDRLLPDPYAPRMQTLPDTASEWRDLDAFAWSDGTWCAYRARELSRDVIEDRALNAYRVSLGAWKKRADGASLSCAEVADELAVYAKQMGYTHVEPVGVCEPIFADGLLTGAFSPAAAEGTPTEFMKFVDRMHEAGLGVILDWRVAHALSEEITPEERSFLLSSAAFWCDTYHVDGLRMPACAHSEAVDAMLSERYPDVLSVTENPLPKSDNDEEPSADFLRMRLLRMMTLPGKKRLVMGCELGRVHAITEALDWSLAEEDAGASFRTFVSELNHLYLQTPALWEESGEDCIESVDTDADVSVYHRRALDGQTVTVAINPSDKSEEVSFELPAGAYVVLIDTDEVRFGGASDARGALTVGESGTLTLALAPTSGIILAPQ